MRDDMPKPRHNYYEEPYSVQVGNAWRVYHRASMRLAVVVSSTTGFALGVLASYVYWF